MMFLTFAETHIVAMVMALNSHNTDIKYVTTHKSEPARPTRMHTVPKYATYCTLMAIKMRCSSAWMKNLS